MPYFEAKKAGGSAAFNYRMWLYSASISLSGYSSLADVLADEVALRKLMTIHTAVDYLADWDSADASVVAILNNDLAAKWITLRDYAEDTLTAAYGTLMSSIGKYGYGEWCIMDSTTNPVTWGPKGNVPIMTGESSPYGKATASSYNSSYKPWQAFDQTDTSGTDRWATTQNPTYPAWLQYDFNNLINVKRIKCKMWSVNQSASTESTLAVTATIQGSNDGFVNDVHSLGTLDFLANYTGYYEKDIGDGNYYRSIRITLPSGNGKVNNGGSYAAITFLQYYGRELKVSIPTMTLNNSPFGIADRSSIYDSNHEAKMAMNKQVGANNAWASQTNKNVGEWISYNFERPVCIKGLAVLQYIGDARKMTKVKIQGSNDGSQWTDIGSEITLLNAKGYDTSTINDSEYHDLPAATYKMFRLMCTAVQTPGTGIANLNIYNVNFYGKDYSEYDWDQDNPRHYLYDHGIELKTINFLDNKGTKKPSYLQIGDGTRSSSIAYVNELMDLTNYSLERIASGKQITHIDEPQYDGHFTLAVGKTIPPGNSGSSWYGYRDTSVDENKYNIYFDISNISTGCPLVGWGGTYSQILDVEELWLE